MQSANVKGESETYCQNSLNFFKQFKHVTLENHSLHITERIPADIPQ
jgi:hypothetical protein